jgi:hypothetical protein
MMKAAAPPTLEILVMFSLPMFIFSRKQGYVAPRR